ncbi:hypothetical protein PQ462_16640 [Flavobacterium sp. KACC 22758]|jgi:hypothetical protein|uniref:hypothetical protein n=1 Tax=Flavobacterium sp. KACC 22758 TaxID=3025667 RepID=UPI0023659A81|nr:hypothetical protein [Flavobacterium sp. KACC 22758]WDF58344.1 hypothetical protein PQ462_16640 [Flavobacterium sp. KACC 22758]
MKKIILAIVLNINLISCNSQEKIDNAMDTEERISAITDKIKYFDYQPIYRIKIETTLNYEITINDLPIAKKNNNDVGTLWFPINYALLKSGTQELQIKIYPSYKDKYIPNLFFTPNSKFNLEIEKTAWDKNGNLEEPKIVMDYELPKYKVDNNGNSDYKQPIDYSRQNILIKDFSFIADVPYKLEGWSDSEDLSKLDQETLHEKVLRFCEDLVDRYKEEDFDYVKTKYLKADIEWYQSEYLKKDVIKKYQNAMNANKGKFINHFIPLSEYKMLFYGDNKIITIERSDIKNKGKSFFLHEKIDKEGNKKLVSLDLYLHIPKGSTELEIIR